MCWYKFICPSSSVRVMTMIIIIYADMLCVSPMHRQSIQRLDHPHHSNFSNFKFLSICTWQKKRSTLSFWELQLFLHTALTEKRATFSEHLLQNKSSSHQLKPLMGSTQQQKDVQKTGLNPWPLRAKSKSSPFDWEGMAERGWKSSIFLSIFNCWLVHSLITPKWCQKAQEKVVKTINSYSWDNKSQERK